MTALPLQVRTATKRFGAAAAVDAVDLDVHPGEIVVLVGPSGCGKSTLLRAVAGLAPLDEGEITVGGEVVDDGRVAAPPERRAVGIVFQEHALFPHLTIAGNVAFGLRRQSASDRAHRVGELLDMVGIAHLAERYPHEVSGGERQRASVVRAIAPRPALLLLDEPFAALDPNLRDRVRTELVAMLRATATPAVFVSHDRAEALALGDRVAVMRDGRLEQIGTGPDVYERPVNGFVAAFMGDATFLPISPDGEGWRTEIGPIDPGVVDQLVDDVADWQAVIRPSAVDVEPDDDGAGVVVGRTYEGPSWRYDVRLGSGVVLRATAPHRVVLELGARVAVHSTEPRPALVPDGVPVPSAARSPLPEPHRLPEPTT